MRLFLLAAAIALKAAPLPDCSQPPLKFKEFYAAVAVFPCVKPDWAGCPNELTHDVMLRFTDAMAAYVDYSVAYIRECKQ